jgi:hypothetical protein
VGPSLEDQRNAVALYFGDRLQPLGYAPGRIHEDGAEDAAVPLRERPGGRALSDCLESGDAVIISESHLAFVCLRDLTETCQAWAGRGIRLCLLDFPEKALEHERFTELLAQLAAFKRGKHSECMREVASRRRELGLALNGASYGFKAAGRTGQRKLVPDPSWRRIGEFVLRARLAGRTWESIYFRLLELGERREDGREWSLGSLVRAFWGEVRLRIKEGHALGGRTRNRIRATLSRTAPSSRNGSSI